MASPQWPAPTTTVVVCRMRSAQGRSTVTAVGLVRMS